MNDRAAGGELEDRWEATNNEWAKVLHGQRIQRSGSMWRGNPTVEELKMRKVL